MVAVTVTLVKMREDATVIIGTSNVMMASVQRDVPAMYTVMEQRIAMMVGKHNLHVIYWLEYKF